MLHAHTSLELTDEQTEMTDVYGALSGLQIEIPDPSRDQRSRTLLPGPNTVGLHDVGFSIRKMWTADRFESLLETRQGRQRLRSFLTNHNMSTTSLDLYSDLRKLAKAEAYARLVAVGIRETFVGPVATLRERARPDVLGLVSDAIGPCCDKSGLSTPTKVLLDELYTNEFQTYIRHQLLLTVTAQLARLDIGTEGTSGLGEAFVLSNPRIADCPIVLCSPAFCALTGYKAEEIVGLNCRFLQGRATSSRSIRTLKNAISKQEPVTQLILNYTKAGKPFWNLLCIIPIIAPSGEMLYSLGGQTDVTLNLGDAMTSLEDVVSLDNRSSTLLSDLLEEIASDEPVPAPIALDTPPLTPLEPRARPALKAGPSSSYLLAKTQKRSRVAEPLHDSTRRPLTDAIASISSVYERAAIVNVDSFKITYVTPGFLDVIGQKGATQHDAANTPLLNASFFDLLHVRTDAEARASTRTIKQSMQGRTASSCAVSLRSLDVFGTPQAPSGGRKESSVRVNLHMTTLQDLHGADAAYVVIVTLSSQ